MYNLAKPAGAILRDNLGRSFPYLRLSITDVCNFRCTYCLPDGYQGCAKTQFLRPDEIKRLVDTFADLGVTKIRLTGGEPTVRKDFAQIAKLIAGHPKIEQLAFTTNGYRLAKNAQTWRDAGLTHINVSMDSFNPDTFHAVTGHNRYQEVWTGVEAALDARFKAVKINTVLLRGINDQSLPEFTARVKNQPISIRFIELMQTGDNLAYFKRYHLPAEDFRSALLQDGWTLRPRSVEAGPAQVYGHPDYKGTIGLIAPYSKDFCQGCNRLRVTATGDLRLCLFGDFGIPLRPLLQHSDQQAELTAIIQKQLTYKASSHFLAGGNTGITPNLSTTGG